ncbi:oligosaccharide repeat unit polymerase [Thiomicrorhabdus hydrogeniphila]
MIASDLELFAYTLPVFMAVILGVASIKSQRFHLLDIFWFVSYLMFVIRPLQMVNLNVYKFIDGPTAGYNFNQSDFITATLILSLFYFIVYFMTRKLANTNQPRSTTATILPVQKLMILLFGFILTYVIYIKMAGGFSNVLLPRSEKIKDNISQGAFALFGLLTVVYFYFFYIYLTLGLKLKVQIFPIILILTGLLLIISNPLNTPRFFLLATWVPIFFLLMKDNLSVTKSYLSAFFVIIFIFPILSLSTRFGLERASTIDINSLFSNMWKLPYIDTYDMLIYLIHRLADIGFRYGESLIGMIFFFVPRAIWEGKPTLIALDLGDELFYEGYAGTPNLSMFYAGELYMDFWYFGVLLAAIATGWILKVLHAKSQFDKEYNSILVLIILSSVPIIIRGPFAAVIGLVFFQILSFYLIRKFLQKGWLLK